MISNMNPEGSRNRGISVGAKVAGVAIAGVFVVSCCGIYGLWGLVQAFRIEDAIHRCYGPIVVAVYNYERKEGRLPVSLGQLVPNYLQVLRDSQYAERSEYKVLDGSNSWQFAVYSQALGKHRVYLHRSTGAYTSSEQADTVLRYHGIWTVIETDMR